MESTYDEIKDLLEHMDHDTKVVYYGDREDPVSVTLECMDCGCILVHFRNDARGVLEIGAIDEEEYNPEFAKCTYIADIENGEVRVLSGVLLKKGYIPTPQLCIGECECGFHFGVDATYLDQIGDYFFECPACHRMIDTSKVFPED